MAITISPATLPDGEVGTPYVAVLRASGGTEPYAWSEPYGLLPAGLSIDPASGRIAGKPTAPMLVTIVVRVVDAGRPASNAKASLNLRIVDRPPAALAVVTSSLPRACVEAPYDGVLEARGGRGPYSWSLAGGALPTGLDLLADGRIAGSPSAGPASASFTAQVRDASVPPQRATVELAIAVDPFVGWHWVYALSFRLVEPRYSQHEIIQYQAAAGRLPMSATRHVDGGRLYDLVLAPDRRHAYVSGSFPIHRYAVDRLSGALTPSAPLGLSMSTSTLGFAPDGRSAYGSGDYVATIAQFDVDVETGALVPKTPPSLPSGRYPSAVVVAPDGGSVYATTAEGIWQYDVGGSGELRPKRSGPISLPGRLMSGMVISPAGRTAYAHASADGGRSAIHQYDIDSTGVLIPMSPATVRCAGGGRWRLAMSSDGRSLYAVSPMQREVWQYRVDGRSGALEHLAAPKSWNGVETFASIALSPDDLRAYVASRDRGLLIVDVDRRSGALGEIIGGYDLLYDASAVVVVQP